MLILLAAAYWYLVWHRLLAYLRYFQQEGYEHLRFLRWVHLRSLTDPALWLALVAGLIAASAPLAAALVFMVGALLLVLAQPDPRRTGKIPLKLTWRATRVLAAAFALASAVWVVLVLAPAAEPVRAAAAASAALLAAAPLLLIAANACLMPYERHVQRGYEAEARERVAQVQPFIIGITGSYGKSSTKAILAHILQYKAPTLAAFGSINTLMGLTRHIREELVIGHKFMVVEMGAFRTGSIRGLCRLTPHSAALITAVGDMHLERFGSID